MLFAVEHVGSDIIVIAACLKAGPDDEAFILPFMAPEVQKGDIVNLAPHHFYMKTTSDESEDAFSGETVPLEVVGPATTAKAVTGSSRKLYGTSKKKVEAHLEELLTEQERKVPASPAKKKTPISKKNGSKGIHRA